MSYDASVDAWIDMYHSIRRLARQDTLIFLTDNAIGQAEEENLAHLTANLAGELAPARIVPFLTAKHSLDYIQLYAARAASHGFEALTVVGGDRVRRPAPLLSARLPAPAVDPRAGARRSTSAAG